ncbi:MAG: exodeoxyribonuclease VII large subunit [Epsilonproteobacteria bacterium]|nr:exodeoxyribonuclease VII large subunit [Campylobacterota bacterium]
MQALSVSTLTNQIKSLLETSFSRVLVEGELSRITYHNSGHIYFTLKDNGATIRAVMFRGNATKLKFRLEEGLKVIIDASITLYTPRGEYQLNCFSIEPSGQGALAFAFEQLKNKLSQKGYFDPSRKKQLPKFPKKVALITSATGAALQDMLRVAQARYRLVEFDIYDVLVQGENAAQQIANTISYADTKDYDVIVIGRGGGSIEDLWAFNEEIVADAVFLANTPIISAVGHEIDTVISDYVADVRAATPSNAMEILLPDSNELLLYIDTLIDQFEQTFTQKIQQKQQLLHHLYQSYEQHSIEKKLSYQLEVIQQLKLNLSHRIQYQFDMKKNILDSLKREFPPLIYNILQNKHNQLQSLHVNFEANNPKQKTKKGFAQVVKENKIADISELHVGEEFELQNSDIILTSKVLSKRNIL